MSQLAALARRQHWVVTWSQHGRAQSRDRQRDHAQLVAGRTVLRFTHDQIVNPPGYVQATLTRVVERLASRACLGSSQGGTELLLEDLRAELSTGVR